MLHDLANDNGCAALKTSITGQRRMETRRYDVRYLLYSRNLLMMITYQSL